MWGSRKWEETGGMGGNGIRRQGIPFRPLSTGSETLDEERCGDEGILEVPESNRPLFPSSLTLYSPQVLVFKTEPCACLIAQVT